MSEATEILNGILMTGMAIALVLAFIRVVRGPSLPDRVVALDVFSAASIGMAGVYAMANDNTVFLDVALVIALIAFVGTVGFARYMSGPEEGESR